MITSNAMRKTAGAVLALAVIATTACSDFLEVEDPGRFTDEALNDPNALRAVANGVEGDLMGAYDDYATFSGLMTDELQHTGTWAQWEDMDRGRQGPLIGTDNGVHSSFLQSRTAAQKAQERFTTVMKDSANRTLLMARAVATEAWANLLLGMHACENPVGPNGAIVPDIESFKAAIPLMTKAADIAKSARSTDYERFAIAGRARANLFAGNLAAAAADAALIPTDFVFNAKYSETGTGNSIVSFAHFSRLKAGGLDPIHQSKVDTIAGFMRDPYTAEHDRRLPFTRRGNGADNVKRFYNQEKWKTLADDIRMASGKEMRLIEAEVLMKQGNLAGAIEKINVVRAAAGLRAHATTGLTAANVQEKLLWERFAELYLEGHRMHDLARFNLVGPILGTGRATKFPMNATELQLNPNVAGQIQGRCPRMS